MKKNKIYSIGVLWLIIDQIVKTIITTNLELNDKITIIPNFFKIYYVQNEGAAFSTFSGMRYLLIGIGIIAFLILERYIRKNKITQKLEIISLGMILGGILGNLIDRLIYGYVIDYLSFIFFGYSFAIFNIADIGIVIGIILLLIDMIRGEKNGTSK